MTSPFHDRAGTPVLRAGAGIGIDALGGAVSTTAIDLQTLARTPLRIERRYDSSRPAGALGFGWSVAIDGRAVELAPDGCRTIHAGTSVIELERRADAIVRLEVRIAGTSVCVRRFEHERGCLVRVRDQRDRVLEHYGYDGPLLVAAQRGERATRYFEYDGRGRRARCVRTWSATTRFDRALTYTRDATVVDDGVGETWVVRRRPRALWLDPELREHQPAAEGAVPGAAAPTQAGSDVDGRVCSIQVGHEALAARADAIGRLTAVTSRSGDRITWDHEGPRVRAVLERGGRVAAWLTADVDDALHVHELVDARSGRRVTACFDADGELAAVAIDGASVAIERDGEGRVSAVSCAGAAVRMGRDRSGRLQTLALEDGRCIAAAEAWDFALGPIDGEVVRGLLEWSPEVARSVLDGSPRERAHVASADPLAEHVAVAISHARALGLRVG